MKNFILKMFDFLKNSVKFLEIVIIFFTMLIILYWIQHLIGTEWVWLSFFYPILDSIIFVVEYLTPDSLFNTENYVQYKYIASLLLLAVIYFSNRYILITVEMLENIYINVTSKVKKIREDKFNNDLIKNQKNEQNLIKKYVVYVSSSVNDKKSYGQEVSLDEQNKIMNKFLIEKTSVLPEVFEDGFLYKFNDFDSIDNVLDVFYKLLQSNAPLDYLIVVHAYKSDFNSEIENLKKLIALKLVNKMYLSSETSYRYGFNKNKKYETSQLGIFQKDDITIEVLNFVKKD